MITLKILFGLMIFNSVVNLVRLGRGDYPRYEETPAWADVLSLLINVALAVGVSTYIF